MTLIDFDDIRPFTDEEIPVAMQRVAESPQLKSVVDYLFPGTDVEKFKAVVEHIGSSHEFQEKVMFGAIGSIVAKTCTSLTHEGFKELDNTKANIFISNHRDILLDPAFLQYILFGLGKPTSYITFGDNLISSEFALLIARCNKMVKVFRNVDRMTLFRKSMQLSEYMRCLVNEQHSSVWLAQRNGRAKEGNDATEQGIVKLLSLSGGKDFVENLSQMHIRPFAVSYEYETCDKEKCHEIYVSKRQKYVKGKDEDLNSILTGILSFKGNVHYQMADEISKDELEHIAAEYTGNDRFCALARLIDLRIWKSYKLWKNNYIAYYLQTGKNDFARYYQPQDVEAFEKYMQGEICQLEGDMSELRDIFLSIYANPLINKINNNIIN